MPWLNVCALDEVPDGGGIGVLVGTGRLAILRRGMEVFALEDSCTHRRLPLHDGMLGESFVRCRTHGSCFDLRTGTVVRGPASRPVRAYATRIADGRVEIEVV